MAEQKPSVGRIVHYTSEDVNCMAAIIVGVLPGEKDVELHVFPPFDKLVPKIPAFVILNEDHKMEIGLGTFIVSNTWHWPERVG
jgi:hypothetical protein|tara:strand:- start:1636 stop:1887 length:252 start_codon:yes stop_codon:yes gene_type:complete